MDEKKKSFVLYGDMQGIVQKLPTEKAGELFLLILKYVNGEQVEINDLLLEIAFEPIKAQLDRDTKKWQDVREARSEAGKKGGRPKKQEEAKKPIALFDKQTEAKKAVTVTVTETVNATATVTETVKNKKATPAALVYPSELDNPSFHKAWAEWEAYRRERKLAKLKPMSITKQFNKLIEIGSERAIAAIDHSISSNYQGIFEPSKGGYATQQQKRLDEIREAYYGDEAI